MINQLLHCSGSRWQNGWLGRQSLYLYPSLYIIWGFQNDQNRLLNTIVQLGKIYIYSSPKKLVLQNFTLVLKDYYVEENFVIKGKEKSKIKING